MIIWEIILTAAVGAVITFAVERGVKGVLDAKTAKRENQDNNHIKLEGKWYAAWDTVKDGTCYQPTEHVSITQKGGKLYLEVISLDEEVFEFSYEWVANLEFRQGKYVTGSYHAKRDQNVNYSGVMYLAYASREEMMLGKWTGAGHDKDIQDGWIAIAKTKNKAIQKLRQVRQDETLQRRVI